MKQFLVKKSYVANNGVVFQKGMKTRACDHSVIGWRGHAPSVGRSHTIPEKMN